MRARPRSRRLVPMAWISMEGLTSQPGPRTREGAAIVHGERERDAASLVEQGRHTVHTSKSVHVATGLDALLKAVGAGGGKRGRARVG